MFSHPDYDGHEELVHAYDAASGLRAIVALHSTALGPAFGGCRMYPYADEAQALTDVLRLSRGMTYKAAICELPYGGGKSVILADPRRDKTPELLRAMGRADRAAGRPLHHRGRCRHDARGPRGDARGDEHTAGATAAAQAPLAVTAHGVLMAIEAAVRHYYQRDELAGLQFAVQGLGNVGCPAVPLPARARAPSWSSRTWTRRGRRQAADELGAEVVGPEAIYDQPVDVFAPCALGAVLDDAPSRACACGWSSAGPTTSWPACARCGAGARAGSPSCPTTSPTPAA